MADEKDFAFSPTLGVNTRLSPTNEKGVITNTNIKSLMAANGLVNRAAMQDEWTSKFSRIPFLDPTNSMGITHEYVFFTKPDLHLLKKNNKEATILATSLTPYSFFNDMVDRYPHIMKQLQLSANPASTPPFMQILSNTIRSELEVPSLESENDIETGANVYGTKITYRGSSYASDQDLSFSIEFEDNKYLEVYTLFKIYDEYCRLKNMGMIELDYNNDDDQHWIEYTLNKVLHDQFSIYKFITDADGMSLIYWCKYTGVFPTGAPRDAFSSMDGGPQKLTVQFKANFFRDMDTSILAEFNKIGITDTGLRYNKELPLFNSTLNQIDGTWATIPYIHEISDPKGVIAKMQKYELRWKA